MTQDDIIAKVRKLLALAAGNANEHESKIAAEQAARLIEQHRLDTASVEIANGGVSEGIEDVRPELFTKATESWRDVLLNQVAKQHGVCALKNRRSNGQTYRLWGTKSDIELTLTMFHWLDQEIERLAKVYTRGQKTSYKRSYKLGAVSSVCEAMRAVRQQVTEQASAGAALVLVSRYKRSQLAMRQVVGRTVRGRTPAVNVLGAYQQGKLDGRSIDVAGGRSTRRLGA